jgi:hypothetical protein
LFQPIRQVKQFLLDLCDQRLPCELPNLLCDGVNIFTASIALVARRRILDRNRVRGRRTILLRCQNARPSSRP